MRILFVAGRRADYLQDLTYAGLASLLGKEAVADFPPHWSYHRQRKHFWSRPLVYPGNLGWVEAAGGTPQGDPRSVLEGDHFDLAVLAACKPDALRCFCSLAESLKAPWIFLDGGDRREIGGDFEREGGPGELALFKDLCRRTPPALVFKRELALGAPPERTFPLQFSINTDRLAPLPPDAAKEYDVLFWAVESSPIRREVFRLLAGRYDCEANGSVAGRTFRRYKRRGEEYFKALNRARIALSFRGEGFDTLRYWEIPASGALLLSERPDIAIPNDFKEGEQALFCREAAAGLTEKIDYYLAHPSEAQRIAAAGQKHLLRYHTHRARAEYLLEVVERELGIRAGV